MVFKNFRYHLTARISLLLLTTFIFSGLYFSNAYTFTQLLLLVLLIIQGYSLYQYINRSNDEVDQFLSQIQSDNISDPGKEKTSDPVHPEFEEILNNIKSLREDQDAQHHYLKTIVQHVGIGIITFESTGDVQIINSAAKKLLSIEDLSHIGELEPISPNLVKIMTELRTGGRDLIRLSRNNEEVQIAVYVIELSLKGKTFKLVSLQNIQSELEEKEMDAWQNLIRVLTHEIMNSVTPISSLAKTLEVEMKEWFERNEDLHIKPDEKEDFNLALHTIHKRSDNLIAFVSEFRNMTRITLPNLRKVEIKEVIDRVLMLLKNEITTANIEINTEIPPALKISIDERQIEQVIINLIKNAIQAVESEKKKKPKIVIKAFPNIEHTVITISDNGTGIEEEALQKIFIPFFTTKKGGSGIGLTLSKQIMRLHQGSITATSTIGEGTTFTLRFSENT